MSPVYDIASLAKGNVDEAINAHLEQLSMIMCTFIFAWTYGRIEASAIAPFWTLYEGMGIFLGGFASPGGNSSATTDSSSP